MSFEQKYEGHPDAARPQVGDGRVDILGQARKIDGRATGEVFVDTADGRTVAVVVQQADDGALRVEIHNWEDRTPVEVFVNDERVYETIPI